MKSPPENIQAVARLVARCHGRVQQACNVLITAQRAPQDLPGWSNAARAARVDTARDVLLAYVAETSEILDLLAATTKGRNHRGTDSDF